MKTKKLGHYSNAIREALLAGTPSLEVRIDKRKLPFDGCDGRVGLLVTFPWPDDNDGWLDLAESVSDLAVDTLLETGYPVLIWPRRPGNSPGEQ